ncbi:elastin [Dendroctonus ponderosae]|uniref:elastin n=1 Tax=Dendroctonus ponderosae TaxID=77166 RepID=UPI00203656B0|nr:elastin [Dendroctonus ponderosae]
MNALLAFTLLGALAYAQAGGIGLAGSIDGAAIIAGPSGTVQRSGLASVGPIASPGAIITGAGLAAPGLIASSIVPGGVVGGLGLGLGLASPGLTAKLLGLEGSGIEGQYVPDLTEKLYDDGSYKPGLHGL